MAASITTNFQMSNIKICSYNMHGFNNGVSIEKSLCKTHDIILLQEHWLLTSNLYKIDQIDNNFQCYSISAMDHKVSSGILVGRPFGGVAILWNKKLSNCVNLLDCDHTYGRFISIKLCNKVNINVNSIVLTCVYFPCFLLDIEIYRKMC